MRAYLKQLKVVNKEMNELLSLEISDVLYDKLAFQRISKQLPDNRNFLQIVQEILNSEEYFIKTYLGEQDAINEKFIEFLMKAEEYKDSEKKEKIVIDY